MLKRLRAVLFPEKEASFDCGSDLETAVTRLSGAVRSSVLLTPFREAVIGRVTAAGVRLRRYRPWIRNDFRPEFVGAFDTSSGPPRLVGRFRHTLGTRLFAITWTGFLLLWTLFVAVAAIAGKAPWQLPLVGVGMLAFGYALLVAGRSMGGRDVEWLSAFIEQNLRGERESARRS